MYYIFLTLAYKEHASKEIDNFLDVLKNIESTYHDSFFEIFDEYQDNNYIHKNLQINIHNNTIIEDLLNDLKIFDSESNKQLKIPQIRYLARILTKNTAESITINGKPSKHRRIHINKKGQQIITQNATKNISL